MNHSPTPWTIRNVSPGGHRDIAADDGHPVCVVTGSGPIQDVQDANAAYIVHACNYFPDAIKLLRQTVDALDKAMGLVPVGPGRPTGSINAQIKDASAFLAKVAEVPLEKQPARS